MIVKKFLEKSSGDAGWINGGFFVLNKKIFNYLENDQTVFEKEPLENLSKEKQLLHSNIMDFGNQWTH